MRIGELAGIIGMTTRAVRRCHRIGLLPEPPRQREAVRQRRACPRRLLAPLESASPSDDRGRLDALGHGLGADFIADFAPVQAAAAYRGIGLLRERAR